MEFFKKIVGLLDKKVVLQQKEKEEAPPNNNNNNNQTETDTSLPSLLPNLPDEVAMQCLARLPCYSRAIASCVCRRWKQALQSYSIQPIRQALHITPEVWVFIYLDNRPCLIEPSSMRAKVIPSPVGLPSEYFTRATSVGGNQKLIFFGLDTDNRPLLCCYDIATESWGRIPQTHVKRWDFACACLGKYVYVAGGSRGDEHFGGKHFGSAERFDMENNVWEEIPPMNYERYNEVGFVMDDRFYVMGTYCPGKLGLEYFDPQTAVWTVVPNNWDDSLRRYGLLNRMPSVAVFRNKVYVAPLCSPRILALDKDTVVWESFEHYDEPLSGICTDILGVGDNIWKIIHYPREIKILSCSPAVKPVEWSRVQLGMNKRFKSRGTCTTFSMG